MARPKSNSQERLKDRVVFRLIESDFNELTREAEKAKISHAEYARMRYLGKELEIRVISRVDEELVKEVIRIGININQIQKAINTSLKAGQELNLAEINLSLSNALQELYLIRGAVK